VECLGEPQYGGGYPVHPQEVWRKLQPYAPTRLATSLTHSEERIWRDYAGLSDYPHYDAYRVSAPSADKWSKYESLGWRDHPLGCPAGNHRRPVPLAPGAESAHALRLLVPGTALRLGSLWRRKRTAPTPEEIRLQPITPSRRASPPFTGLI